MYTIGELAGRTGLTVKAIRFYADRGIVPESGRNAAGHRVYDGDAVARLELVRTLRALGIDLATVRRVVERESTLAEVADAHARALEVQIRTLRSRRAVLTAVARRGSSPEEMDLMHRLASLSAAERRRLVDDFTGQVFAGMGEGVVRSVTPELPDDPSDEQVVAWVELAELTGDDGFREAVARMVEGFVAERPEGLRADVVAVAVTRARPELDPASPEAREIVDDLVRRHARERGEPGGAQRLATRLAEANDPRWARYRVLLAVINGWEAPQDHAPALDWTLAAIRASTGPAASTGRAHPAHPVHPDHPDHPVHSISRERWKPIP
ncbi:MerR family transcriptional regulator [Nonomuraea soli]|uniref:DNA-binding transcriptional MerR regulator n=1 Tax=Nonomuraea soli TaxID=1032476 RepID=A0A7W0HNH0_9ACTN|nr:MerR family transcriptional regulator [Nonomuraea soli]MBA2889763.1 DNA-binding transcriptional MerR regulator [Nonomuraea soli]